MLYRDNFLAIMVVHHSGLTPHYQQVFLRSMHLPIIYIFCLYVFTLYTYLCSEQQLAAGYRQA